ncbi:MAG TPA: hypothetical protein VLF94_03160 [Chlamydiales bacterium]|nr:hypothetical protein [Chlamydiales bacterium]
MSSTRLQFPSADVMTQFLSNHGLLNCDYYRENNITQTVARLSAERFADTNKPERGIEMGIMLIVNDLKTGKDGFSGADLPKIELPEAMWPQLGLALRKALVECAEIPVADSKNKV